MAERNKKRRTGRAEGDGRRLRMEETADKGKGSPNRKTAAMDMNEKQVMRSWASDCGTEWKEQPVEEKGRSEGAE